MQLSLSLNWILAANTLSKSRIKKLQQSPYTLFRGVYHWLFESILPLEYYNPKKNSSDCISVTIHFYKGTWPQYETDLKI